MSRPTLIAVAHGSRDPRAQRTVDDLLSVVRTRLPDVTVEVAYVERAAPALGSVLAWTGPGAVVVPLLLAHGFHLSEDIGRAVREAGAVIADPLGPDPLLCDVLIDRLTESGVPAGTPLVLGAAGSSDPRAVADVERQAELLEQRAGVAVLAAYASATRPSIDDAVTLLRAQSDREPAVATYLLAPGVFHEQLRSSARLVSAPLGAHPAVAALVVRRYRDAADRCLV